MSTDTTQQRRFGMLALIPVLALLLLGTACSEKETMAPRDSSDLYLKSETLFTPLGTS